MVSGGAIVDEDNMKEPTAEGNGIYDLFSDDESVEDGADDGGTTCNFLKCNSR